MATEIVLPKFGNTVEECIIKQWNRNVGDIITVDIRRGCDSTLKAIRF